MSINLMAISVPIQYAQFDDNTRKLAYADALGRLTYAGAVLSGSGMIARTAGKKLIHYRSVDANLLNFENVTNVSGSWVWGAFGTQQPHGGFYYVAAPASGDKFSFQFFCPASGSYTVKIKNRYTSANSGICRTKLDNVEINSTDLYNLVDTVNVMITITPVTISAGVHTLSIDTNGKNAASTNYFNQPSEILIEEA